MKPKYKRVLLKLSGETLLPEGSSCGVSIEAAGRVAREVGPLVDMGVQTTIVIGGGNIFRGAPAAKSGTIEQAQADTMGMLATVINGLALQEGLEKEGIETTLMSAVSMPSVTLPFTRQSARYHLQQGRLLIVSGGTGRPFFSTDTAASLTALEVGTDVILKATKVDGVYSADPMKDSSATRFDKLTYLDVLQKQLKVMDATAISMCMDHNIPVIVFNFFEEGNLAKAVCGVNVGTVVYG